MKCLILTVLVLTFTTSCFGQYTSDKSYKKATIFLDDHRVLKVKNLDINGREASFVNSSNREVQKVPMEKVNLIKIPKGSHLWEGASYVGGVCLGSAIAVSVGENTKQPTTGEFVGFVAGGAVLGGLVGSLFPKWKEAYSGGEFLGQNLHLNLGLEPLENQLVIKISIGL